VKECSITTYYIIIRKSKLPSFISYDPSTKLGHIELRLIYALENMHDKEALIVMGKVWQQGDDVQAYDLSK
jgi:hypothetical protein